jgi:LacI family transcriptional regulator, repressor for deo operon, udp, cdd, tsx, nupC, and nupG
VRISRFLHVDPGAPVPLATQLSQQLAWLIVSGVVEVDEKLPSARELAAHLGIHLHTVRAAYQMLEGDGLVTIRRGSGTTVQAYDRSRLAAAAPDLRSFTIGVIIPAYSPFYAPLLDGIESAAASDPSLFLVCNARAEPRLALKYLDQLVGKRADGVIMISTPLPSGTQLPRAGDLPPIVFADVPGVSGPAVEFDLKGAAAQATQHLIDHGHQHIGLITPPVEWHNVAPLAAGFNQALGSGGLTPDPKLVAMISDFSREEGFEGANRLLDLSEPPTAIVAASDTLAIGGLQAVSGRGLRVPDNVAVVGIDDIDMAAVVTPPLTTVALPAEEMGTRAMYMLSDLIAGRSLAAPRVVLDTWLVIRESCGCPRV